MLYISIHPSFNIHVSKPSIHSPLHSPLHSSIHPFTIHSPLHSPLHSSIHPFTPPFIHPFTPPFIHPFTIHSTVFNHPFILCSSLGNHSISTSCCLLFPLVFAGNVSDSTLHRSLHVHVHEVTQLYIGHYMYMYM